MALITIYLKVLIITLTIQLIIATQTISYPLFTSNTIDQNNINNNNKNKNNKIASSKLTIKPALLRASSLTSLLKKPHLNLFNKPSSVAFLKIKNKKYLPQFIFTGSNKNKLSNLPTYQLATTSIGTSLVNGNSLNNQFLKAFGTNLNSPLTTSITTPIKSIETNNLKSTGSKQIQYITTKPLFVPIDNSLKKLNSWNKLLTYNDFNNNQLQTKTSLPVFVFKDENLNSNEKFIDDLSTSIKLPNDNNNLITNNQQQQHNLNKQNPIQHQQPNQFNHNNNVNQTNSSVKNINYNNQQHFSNDFKPIVSNNNNNQNNNNNNNNNFRTGRNLINFDKGQMRQTFNEVKLPEQIYLNQNNKNNFIPNNNMDFEQNILNTIEKDIELKNLKFIKSIILPKKGKLDDKTNLNKQNNNLKNNKLQNGQHHNMQHGLNNQFNQGNNQINHNQKNNLNQNNFNTNNNFNQNQNQPIQQQSVQHVFKLQQNNNLNNQNDNLPIIPDKINQNNLNHNKDNRPEQSNQNHVKMPKFKIIQYADKSTIEEFTRALENIDFKSITQNELTGLPELVFNKLSDAKIETIIGHKENNNDNNNIQNKNDNYSNNKNNFQTPPLQFFNVNDCAKNRKLRQMNNNNINEQNYNQPQQQNNQQQMNFNSQQQYKNNQQQNNQQQNNQQQNNQQQNNQQQMNYNNQQQVSSTQQKSYFNEQQTNSLNSLVNFDDHINFYSATKLRQLKVLPNEGLNNQLNSQLNQNNNQNNQINDQINDQIINIQSNAHSNNPNNDNEIDDFKKEINDETDQLSNNEKNKPIGLDIDTANLDETTDQLDNLDNLDKKTTTNIETESQNPTKLDLRIVHLPISVLKKLVKQDQQEGKKK